MQELQPWELVGTLFGLVGLLIAGIYWDLRHRITENKQACSNLTTKVDQDREKDRERADMKYASRETVERIESSLREQFEHYMEERSARDTQVDKKLDKIDDSISGVHRRLDTLFHKS